MNFPDTIGFREFELMIPDEFLTYLPAFRIEPVNGYMPVKHVAIKGAGTFVGFDEMAEDPTTRGIALTYLQNCQHGNQAIFVDKTLLYQLFNRDLPKELAYGDLKFPAPAFTFMLPSFFCNSPNDGPVAMLQIAIMEPGLYQIPQSTKTIAISERRYHVAAVSLREGNQQNALSCVDWFISADMTKGIGESLAIDPYNENLLIDQGFVSYQNDESFPAEVALLGIKLLWAYTQNPALLNAGTLVKKVKQKVGSKSIKMPLYQPSWLGKDLDQCN